MGESNSSGTLGIASHLKLKGRVNYGDWKPAMEAAIEGNGLSKWFRKTAKRLAFVDKDDDDADEVKLKAYLD